MIFNSLCGTWYHTWIISLWQMYFHYIMQLRNELLLMLHSRLKTWMLSRAFIQDRTFENYGFDHTFQDIISILLKHLYNILDWKENLCILQDSSSAIGMPLCCLAIIMSQPPVYFAWSGYTWGCSITTTRGYHKRKWGVSSILFQITQVR